MSHLPVEPPAGPDVPPVVYLEPGNPLDVSPTDVQELADALHDRLPHIVFEVAYEEQHGAGVTWYEVLHIFLPSLESLKDDSYDLILATSLTWMGSRVRRAHGKRRPRSVTIWDEESGREISGWVIEKPDDPPVEQPTKGLQRKLPRGRHRP